MALDKQTFRKEDILRTAQELSRNLQYPVSNFGDLVKKLKTDHISIGGHKVDVASLRHDIPEHYFPLRDQKDVENKTQQLYDALPQAMHGGGEKELPRGPVRSTSEGPQLPKELESIRIPSASSPGLVKHNLH